MVEGPAVAAGQRASVASSGLGCVWGSGAPKGIEVMGRHECILQNEGCLLDACQAPERLMEIFRLHNCCFKNNSVSIVVSQIKVCLLSPESANAQEPALTAPACTSDAAGLGFQSKLHRVFPSYSLRWFHWRVFITSHSEKINFAHPRVQQLLTSPHIKSAERRQSWAGGKSFQRLRSHHSC